MSYVLLIDDDNLFRKAVGLNLVDVRPTHNPIGGIMLRIIASFCFILVDYEALWRELGLLGRMAASGLCLRAVVLSAEGKLTSEEGCILDVSADVALTTGMVNACQTGIQPTPR